MTSPCRGFCKQIKRQIYIFLHNYFTSVMVKIFFFTLVIVKMVLIAVTLHSIDVHIYTENR